MRVHDNQFIAILVAVVLASLCPACNKSNPSEALQKELKTIVSWIETTREVGKAWTNGSIPSAYAARTFQTGQENLKQEIENIQSLPVSESAKEDLSIQIQQLENSLGQAGQAIGNSDRPALEQMLTQLATAQQSLNASTK